MDFPYVQQEESVKIINFSSSSIRAIKNILCCLTKQLHQAANYKYAFVIRKDSTEGQQMGLTFDSLIVLDRSLTLKKLRLTGVIGSCPQSVVERIEELLQQMRKNKNL